MDIYVSKYLIGYVAFLSIVSCFLLFIILLLWKSRRKGTFSPFTEDMFRLPGHSLRKEKAELETDFVISYFSFVVSSAALVFSLLFLENRPRIIVMLAAILGLVYLIFKIVQQFGKLQKLNLGCEGEEYTGQELNLLMLKNAFVFHDIPYQYGNIDHVVIGNDRIFAIETKSVRKPIKQGTSSSKQATVKFDGTSLIFPHFKTTAPIEQAKRHGSHIQDAIQKKCGVTLPVMPVVALPEWNIDVASTEKISVLVINPKRAKALHKWLGEIQDKKKRNIIVNYIASVARSISPRSKRTDPDAAKHYDVWFNPKFKEKILGEY